MMDYLKKYNDMFTKPGKPHMAYPYGGSEELMDTASQIFKDCVERGTPMTREEEDRIFPDCDYGDENIVI